MTGVNAFEVLCMATALDPRYKTLRCLSPEEKEQTWTVIEEKLFVAAASDTHDEQPSVSHIEDDSDTVCEPSHKRIRLMDSDSDTDEAAESTAEEFARFKAEKKLSDGENPLMWWKTNEHRFPRLSQLAKNVLCVPATSVPSEKLFSSAGYIVNKRRASLDPQTVNMLVSSGTGVVNFHCV